MHFPYGIADFRKIREVWTSTAIQTPLAHGHEKPRRGRHD